jgi:hypothetical protein
VFFGVHRADSFFCHALAGATSFARKNSTNPLAGNRCCNDNHQHRRLFPHIAAFFHKLVLKKSNCIIVAGTRIALVTLRDIAGCVAGAALFQRSLLV